MFFLTAACTPHGAGGGGVGPDIWANSGAGLTLVHATVTPNGHTVTADQSGVAATANVTPHPVFVTGETYAYSLGDSNNRNGDNQGINIGGQLVTDAASFSTGTVTIGAVPQQVLGYYNSDNTSSEEQTFMVVVYVKKVLG